MKEITFLIILSSITIFIFRVFPFFFKNNKYLNNKDGFVYKTINYSAQAMIGIIVYNSAFTGENIFKLIDNIGYIDIVKLISLLMVFFITVRTKKIIPGFLFCLLFYSLYILATEI